MNASVVAQLSAPACSLDVKSRVVDIPGVKADYVAVEERGVGE